MTDDIGSLFTYLFAIYMSSLVRYGVGSLIVLCVFWIQVIALDFPKSVFYRAKYLNVSKKFQVIHVSFHGPCFSFSGLCWLL